MSNKAQLILSVFLIVITVFIAFWPSLKNDFVNWDDDQYVTNSPFIKDLSFENVKRIFSSFWMSNYHPLTLLSYAVEYRLFRLDPRGYHATNLILHVLNSVLVFWLVFSISGDIPVSLMTAVLFGVHPLHVESVAWVSERKDVLFAFFYLSALIAYIYYLRSVRKARYYGISLVLFIMSILSKSAAITLSPLLFIVDHMKSRKYDRTAILDKLPFFVLSLAFGIVALFSQAGALRSDISLGLLTKLKVASYSIFFYLWKLCLPFKLSCLYPFPRITNDLVPSIYGYALAGAVVLSFAVWLSLRHTKKIFFGASFFFIAIFLNLQFVPLGAAVTADRYTYLPSIGIFIMAGWAAVWLMRQGTQNTSIKVLLIGAFILLIAFSVRWTRERCAIWESGLVLWNDAIIKYGQEYIPNAYFNRGMQYLDYGAEQYAVPDIKKALELYYSRELPDKSSYMINQELPGAEGDYGGILNDLGVKFAEIDQMPGAIILFKTLVNKRPADARAYLNLCISYGRLGNYHEALHYGKQAVAIDPLSGEGYYLLAVAYYLDKQYALARENLQKAVDLGFSVPRDLKQEIEATKKTGAFPGE